LIGSYVFKLKTADLHSHWLQWRVSPGKPMKIQINLDRVFLLAGLVTATLAEPETKCSWTGKSPRGWTREHFVFCFAPKAVATIILSS